MCWSSTNDLAYIAVAVFKVNETERESGPSTPHPSHHYSRCETYIGLLPRFVSFTLKMYTIMYTKTLERLQHIIWLNFEIWILFLRFSQPTLYGVYLTCVSKLFPCFDIHQMCHLQGEWGVLWDLYIRPHPSSALFTLKMVTEIYAEMFKQFHHMVQLNPKARITHVKAEVIY
jgi:hypothetical protein